MFVLLLACAGKDAPSVDSQDGAPDIQSCDAISQVEVEVLPARSVVLIHASTDEEAALSVPLVYALGSRSEDLPPDTAVGTEHSVMVLGLPSLADVQVDLALGDCVESVVFETEAVDWPLPYVTDVTETGGLGVGGWFPVTLYTEDLQYSAILASDGTPVWSIADEGLPLRTRMANDRASVFQNQQAWKVETDGYIASYPLDGSPRTVHTIPGHHTDFAEKDDGTLAVLVFDARNMGSRQILGSSVVEVAPDGTQTTIWSAFDALELDLGVEYTQSQWGDVEWPQLEEWVHINSISYDAGRGKYLLTGGNHGMVIQVDEHGGTDWVVGPAESDAYLHLDDPDSLARPHSATHLDGDRVLVFNRGEFTNVDTCAWVSTYEIDVDAGTATVVDRYESDDCRVVSFFGEARPVREDELFVNYSSAGVLELVDGDGALAYQLQTGLGAAFGYGQYVESLYR